MVGKKGKRKDAGTQRTYRWVLRNISVHEKKELKKKK